MHLLQSQTIRERILEEKIVVIYIFCVVLDTMMWLSSCESILLFCVKSTSNKLCSNWGSNAYNKSLIFIVLSRKLRKSDGKSWQGLASRPFFRLNWSPSSFSISLLKLSPMSTGKWSDNKMWNWRIPLQLVKALLFENFPSKASHPIR